MGDIKGFIKDLSETDLSSISQGDRKKLRDILMKQITDFAYATMEETNTQPDESSDDPLYSLY